MTTELVELADRLDRAIDCAQSASRPIHNGGNTHIRETEDYISNFAALRSEAAAIRALASRAGGPVMQDGNEVAWVAKVMPDWTTLQVMQSGDAYAFNRQTGRVYKLPDPECPFVLIKWPEPPAAPEPVAVG